MTNWKYLALGVFAVGGLVGASVWLLPRAPTHKNCDVNLLAAAVSPDGRLIAEHRRGVCDDGNTVLHTLEIAPVNRKPEERVLGATIHKVQGAERKTAYADVPALGLRWLDKDKLELSHPTHVEISKTLVLSGVQVVGKVVR